MHFSAQLRTLRPWREHASRWDLLVLPSALGILFLAAFGLHQMTGPLDLGAAPTISLDPRHLPDYALQTSLRMAAGMALSLLFTFVYGAWAAKSRRAEQVLIPTLDVLQSIPILGFLSLTVVGFIHLFPGSMLGPELAAVFAIFTSQAWNMAFSFYHSLRMIPADLYHVAAVFQLSAWQRFWRLEVPFAIPNLVWNALMSVAGGWFFVVAAEAITVAHQNILLPGVGSYIAVAIQQQDHTAIGYAIATMLIVILLYDQLIFRPLVAWSYQFKFEFTSGEAPPRSWVLTLLRRAQLWQALLQAPAYVWEQSLKLLRYVPAVPSLWRPHRQFLPAIRLSDRLWEVLIVVGTALTIVLITRFVLSEASYGEIAQVFMLGLYTGLRVMVLMVIASIVWVPIGVWIGNHATLAQRVQPLVLFCAAFPANLIFPLVVAGIVAYHLNVEVWLSPLMILGSQWYILFNVIAGAMAIPQDLREVATSLGLTGWRRHWRLTLPAIFPAYVTGCLTASGGAWNASIVAEVVTWGATTLSATGIGAYIAQQASAGDQPRIALGIAVMSFYVVLLNRVLWARLYRIAERRLVQL